MDPRPTYEELVQRVRELKREALAREKAEAALLESERRYRSLFNESRDAIYITTRDGEFLDANQALLDLFGYTREEVIGKINVRQLYFNPADRERFQEEIEKKGYLRSYEVEFQSRDGAVMECLLTSTVRRSEQGETLGYQGIIRDVTEYNAAQRALKEKEAQYRAVVDAFDGLIYICSRDFRVEFMNRKFLERTGYDAIGALCYKALHDLDKICPWCVNDRVFAGETVHWEMQSPKDNRWYYIVNTPIYHDDGTMSKQAMILDITNRREMEDALRESSEKIKTFAYSVSHDLKSPAVGIYGLAKRLYAHYGAILDDKGKRYCEQILNASEQVASLVNNINVYISAKEMPKTIERVNLKEILQAIREEFSTQMQIRQIAWSEPHEAPEIRADRLSILRILRNLVDNALKYGGEELSRIEIGYQGTESHHIISVKDDGVAIPQEDTKEIFGAFKRKGRSAEIEGTGLGLAIINELVQQHNGSVWVESRPEEGTTFSFSISKSL